MAKVISVCNQKGGVGKTTTTISLGAALVKEGKKVLLIDFDAQANLTMSLGIDQPDELPLTIAGLFDAEIKKDFKYKQDEYIYKNNGIDFIPSDIYLSAIESRLINAMGREYMLKKITERLKEQYDYIIIDCAPSLNMLTINALVACDSVIIPCSAQYLAAKGIELLIKTVIEVKQTEYLNPNIEIEGILITMLDKRLSHGKDMIKTLQDLCGENIKIFETQIPTSSKISQTQEKGLSILEYDKNSKVAISYSNLAKELI